MTNLVATKTLIAFMTCDLKELNGLKEAHALQTSVYLQHKPRSRPVSTTKCMGVAMCSIMITATMPAIAFD
jgi:hypothetical protein